MNQVSRAFRVILDGRQVSTAATLQTLQAGFDTWPAALQQCCMLLQDPAAPRVGGLPRTTWPDLPYQLSGPTLKWIGYISLATSPSALSLRYPWFDGAEAPFLALWMPPPDYPQETSQAAAFTLSSWVATASLIGAVWPTLGQPSTWSFLAIAQALEQRGVAFQWRVLAASDGSLSNRPVGPAPSVLAVVPHYQCQPWLHRCLTSLMQQTRPLDHIVVVDDGSPQPPLELLADFPSVTLLASSVNVGPYRLIQQVIEDTAYDYYCFQDADDWSSCDRLARLLATARQTNADLVGTQEIRVDAHSGALTPVSYPLDVNTALREKPGHPLLHPTSLVSRRLVMAVGGFATGLRFGGDTEFLLRAVWVGRIVNDVQFAYFRQKRPHSLTTQTSTGLGSPARQALLSMLKNRAIANQAARRQADLNLTPLRRAARVTLRHLGGPPLR
ncbi:MAG: glycosyltransferase family 2 protein [Cyanobacteria bacterium P01_E01_bin.43]